MTSPPKTALRIAAENLSVRHRKGGSLAVDEVSLSVPAGVCAAIVGPNGAGKSTLLRALAGLGIGETTGNVRLCGDELRSLSVRETAARRAFVPQDTAMAFAFTVREAITLGGDGSQRPVDAALDALELTGFADRSVLALSGGERQRVAIARAIAQGSPVLLLDEPTAHQDLRYSRRILDFLQRFVRESPDDRAVVAVLHDLNLAASWADIVFLIQRGRLIASGPPAETLTVELLSRTYETAIHTEPFIRAATT